jgi:YggT family protein
VLFSWIHVNEFNPAVRWICRITDPLLDPIRRILPTGSLPIDFSPLVLLLLLSLAERLIVGVLF